MNLIKIDIDLNPYIGLGLSLDKVINHVSNYANISIELIKSTKRNKNISMARQLFCSVAKDITNSTLQEIGDYINRDHSTVIHARKSIKNKFDYKSNMFYLNFYSYLSQFLKN